MNPVRSLSPDVVRGDFGHLWVYPAGPAVGLAVAVGSALILRGSGGDPQAALAAGGIDSEGGHRARPLEG